MPPAQVLVEVLASLERDVLEVRVGTSSALYDENYRQSPEVPTARFSAVTGGG